MRLSRLVIVAAAFALTPPLSAVSRQLQPGPCTFPPAEVAWLQGALDHWARVARTSLRIDPSPLPLIVLFDRSCVWRLSSDAAPEPQWKPADVSLVFAGALVRVSSASHGGTVTLPSGAAVAIEPRASTALYRNSRDAFVSIAMPSVWQLKTLSAQTRGEYLQGAFSHEMTHTRLLVAINRRVRELARKHDLVYPINDDVVQAQFRQVRGFEAAIDRERDALYRAAAEPDPVRRRALAAKALDLVRTRRARYFTGSSAAYAELESLFLTMEGVGQWAAYQVARTRTGGSDAEALRLVRDDRKYWSQDEGLALFLLVDTLVPDWQPRVFAAPLPASPIDLLAERLSANPM
jgi:hypothetical protein